MSQDQRCERARQSVSLQVDGELSEFEQALLRAHLARCPHCRAFDAQVGALTAEVRAVPLEPLERPIALPRRRRTVVGNVQLAAAAAVAVLVAGLGTILGGLSTDQAAPRMSDAASRPAFLQSVDYELRLAERAKQKRTSASGAI